VPERRAFVIGDFHLGCGDELEDFDQDDRFAGFLDAVPAEGTSLYLNGDIIDFAQIPPFDVPEEPHLLWGEDASLAKLDRAVAAHPAWFAALARFLDAGGRVHVLAGNHDLDLVWPAVQARLAGAVGAPGASRLSFTTGAERYGGVHIQHGHHFCPENSPVDPERFVHVWPVDGERYLERVWGTDFLLSFFNDIERRYPFADNVKPHAWLLWQGLRHRWIGPRELVRLASFLRRRNLPLGTLLRAAHDDDADLRGHDPADLVAGSFADEGMRAAVDGILADERFRRGTADAVDRLGPAGRRALRDGRAPALGALDVQAAATGRDHRDRRAARRLLARADVTHVVFGHTHEIVDERGPSGHYLNPGTWLPRLDLDGPAGAQVRARGVTLDVLADPALYATDAFVVRIAPGADGADVALTRV
jgi:UDP-2,3-diacylglucosamine pyrophosphatase LpxH